MPRPYTDSEKEKIKENIMLNGLKLIHERGYTHTSITDITQAAGVSKAFFYTMFPSKEAVVTEALKRQERIAVQKAQEIANISGLTQREKLVTFLKWLISVMNHTFFFLTPGEAGYVSQMLTEQEREVFFKNLVNQQKKILQAFLIDTETVNVYVFGNLVINLFMVCSSREKMYCYHQESFDDTLLCLIRGIADSVCPFSAK